MNALFLGEVMFGRKRKKETDGQMCPLCQLVNAQDAETCTRCYYEFTIAAHRQTVSEITDEETGGLFDALMEEDEEDEDDSPLVDWTSHSFSMDDMTVEVSPYDEQGLVEVDQSVSMDHQFDAPQQVARVKGKQEEEEEEYVLTAADAPKNVTKFDTGDGPDLAFQEEEYSTPVVKLVEMTESADIEPVQSASEVQDDDSSHGETETTPEPESEAQPIPEVSPPVPSIPAIPPTPIAPAVASTPAIPAIPPTSIAPAVASTPAIPANPPVPAIPSTPTVPNVPVVPAVSSPTSVPTPASTGIWPWPQSDAWDDATVRKMLRDAMESAKSGDIDTSKRTLVTLGPHLGDRIDLVFHIGVLLKKFKQEEVMCRMIEAARVQHPTSPDVAKAVQHLLS
ncbi:MAG: hypothetical protein CND85_02420 [Marine Group II euryarchaeote MED-G33]|nr:MAG: hypothetical protein CND85_02420 [Marine Group II euryarchaeote MED-G33]